MADTQPGQGPTFVYPLPRDPQDLIKNPLLLWRALDSLQRRVGGPGLEDRIFIDQSLSAMGDATLAEVSAGVEELRGVAQVLDAGQQALAAQIEEEARALRSDFAGSRATDATFGEGEVQQEIAGIKSELSALRALLDATRGSENISAAELTAASPIIYDGHGGFSLGTVDLTKGGTNATTASGARTNLGLAIGTDVQAYDADLAALAALASNGMIARTGAGTVSARTITEPAAGLTVTNGDGVSGNPTLALANDLAALEALTGSDVFPVRTGTDTWAMQGFKTGSVTPTFSLATAGTSSFTHSTQTGAYVVIGKLVFLDFNCAAAFTVGTGSGNLQITIALDGVTISIDNTGLSAGPIRFISSTFTWPAGTTSISVTPGGTTFLRLNAHGTGIDSVAITAANMTTGTTVQVIGAICLIVT